jgi:hypothetical protein
VLSAVPPDDAGPSTADRYDWRAAMAAADGLGQVQFIIADNQLPASYRRDYDEIDFTYDSPTVSTVPHPGPDAAKTIAT